MPNVKFKVGDTVRIINGSKIEEDIGSFNAIMLKQIGEIHKIIHICEMSGIMCYTLDGSPCIWDEKALESVKEHRRIVINEKNGIVHAVFYLGSKLMNDVTEKYNKNNVFSFNEYAKKAIDKLFENNATPEKKTMLKPLNTKIFVVDGYDEFKSGHIYEIKDGKIIDNDGWRYPFEGSFYNMDDVHKYFNDKNDDKYNSVGEKMGGYTTKKQVKVMEVKEG